MKDTRIADLIAGEEQRERDGLELIPSENYVSRDVLTALGSIFTNKYSEAILDAATTVARTLLIRLSN